MQPYWQNHKHCESATFQKSPAVEEFPMRRTCGPFNQIRQNPSDNYESDEYPIQVMEGKEDDHKCDARYKEMLKSVHFSQSPQDFRLFKNF